jgi:hypothetical protein
MNELITQQSEALKPYLDGLQKRALLLGILGLVATIAGYFIAPHSQFFQSYLLAFVFWISLPLGSLCILMIHQVAGGTWGFSIRRLLEAGSRTLPLMFLFSLPILFLGIHELYEWSHMAVVDKDPLLTFKKPYLNESSFIIRTFVYFVIWGALTYLLNKWSRLQDQIEQTYPTRRIQKLSGPGIVIFFLTVTMASVDWIMSLEPHWFSSIFGIVYIIGQGLITWAFMTLVAVKLSTKEPLSKLLTSQRLSDLGTFMLGTVMLWAYTSFSQLLIIWSGNLPEEITWYITRLEGGWEYIGYGLILFHFAIPFLFLISSTMKAKTKVLVTFAIWLIVAHFFELLWQTRPSFTKINGFHSTGFTMHWLDLAITLGIGGLLVSFFFAQLKTRPLLALNDPRFPELYSADDEHNDHG